MSLVRSVVICTYYDDSQKGYGDISKQINEKWMQEQNEYYNSITDVTPTQQVRYNFSYDHASTLPKSNDNKTLWNKMPVINRNLNELKTPDDDEDEPINKYSHDYVMYVDPKACLRTNNSYKDLFESIVTKYSCKNFIFSSDEKSYMAYFVIFFAFLLLLLLATILYLFTPYNRIFFISLISLLVIGMLVVLIVAAVQYTDNWCVNSDVFIVKNSEYSRKMINYWMSRDCYNTGKNPFQKYGCLKKSFMNNVNKIRNNSIVMDYGVITRNVYDKNNESLAITFVDNDDSKAIEELNKLK